MAYISFQPNDYFNTLLYTGDGSGSNRSLTGVGFQPDWVWNKSRSNAYNHYLFDAPRGAGKRIGSNSNAVEDDKSAEFISFDSDGFTVNNNGSSLAINASGVTFANWCWKGGTTSGIATNGSTVITPSAYSFNQTSGFSIVKYQGNGNTTTKVAHGLGVAPKWIVIKNLDDTDNWRVYHVGMGNTTAIQLNSGGGSSGGSDHFYDQDPDTVNFTLGDQVAVNNNGENYIAYCFAQKPGFSAFGKYIGSGSETDSPYIYTGHKPAMVIAKKTSGTSDWIIWDDKRDGYNETIKRVYPNESAAEESTTTQGIDFLSNGFKLRGTSSNAWNSGNDTYIYMSFASEPLVSSNGVPATAR